MPKCRADAWAMLDSSYSFSENPIVKPCTFFPRPPHQPRQERVRIDSAAQEQTERNVAAQTQAETFIQLCPNFIERFAITALNLWSAAKRPITLHLRFPG